MEGSEGVFRDLKVWGWEDVVAERTAHKGPRLGST